MIADSIVVRNEIREHPCMEKCWKVIEAVFEQHTELQVDLLSQKTDFVSAHGILSVLSRKILADGHGSTEERKKWQQYTKLAPLGSDAGPDALLLQGYQKLRKKANVTNTTTDCAAVAGIPNMHAGVMEKYKRTQSKVKEAHAAWTKMVEQHAVKLIGYWENPSMLRI